VVQNDGTEGDPGHAGVAGRTTGDRFAPAPIAATAKRKERRDHAQVAAMKVDATADLGS
jgi:hypothetical protein